MPNETLAMTYVNTLNINPPEEFSRKAEHWDKYLTRFARFRAVKELDKKPGELQVSTLLYMTQRISVLDFPRLTDMYF